VSDSQLAPIAYNKNKQPISMSLTMLNRHGLIAGATGTGKSVTLQSLTERMSAAGISVFTADVKGDLSGLAQPGGNNPKVLDRVKALEIDGFTPRGVPTLFWDIFGKSGHPVRTTVSEVGPVLLGRILGLNETQQQVLELCITVADDNGLLLLDLKDLRELLAWIGENLGEIKGKYGSIAPASLGTIQRAVVNLSEAGGDGFFGEPAIRLEHLQQRDFSGNGVVSVLDGRKLLQDPRLYSTFLLWLLSELFETLPEVGDLPAPKMVFFFDEAHLLFNDAPNALVQKIETVVRLIRSKGVGVFFVTQNPADIPETVLAQLGNRFQHALRAYTPSEQKAVRAAASSFRANPDFDTGEAITELQVGEALVSVLDKDGRPTVVERALIAPPASYVGQISDQARAEIVGRSPIKGVYEQAVDRESAFEVLTKRKQEQIEQAEQSKSGKSAPAPQQDSGMFGGVLSSVFGGGSSRRQSAGEAMVKSVARSIGSTIGRQIVRGILGSISGGRR
jgi:DNA helicase HerA-like ATPase